MSQARAEDLAVWHHLDRATSAAAFHAAWLDMLCRGCAGAIRGVLVLGDPTNGEYAPAGLWPSGEAPTPELAQAAGQAIEANGEVISENGGVLLLACPLVDGGLVFGCVAIQVAAPRKGCAAMFERMRMASYALVAARQRQEAAAEQATRERLIATLDLVASALNEPRFASAAPMLATELATRLDCDRVSIGFVEKLSTKVVAVSHSGEFGGRMNLIRAIGQAMDEAIDLRTLIVLPAPADDGPLARDHLALARLFGNDSLLTIPFELADEVRGAFTFERSGGSRVFDAATIELCQAIVALCARILEHKRLNDRPLRRRVVDEAHNQLRRLTGPRYYARKLAAAIFMTISAFFALVNGDYRVNANASVEGAVRQVLAAPFDGYVASAPRRAGDVVAANEVIAVLDDREMRMEYFKWLGQQSQYARQYEEAMAKHDRGVGNVALAQMQQAEAQAALYASQIERARIVTPLAGVVVSGDLSQSLGGAVKRGQTLFEVSPSDRYRVVLEVPDVDIANVSSGHRGVLALAALPGENFRFTVTRVTPVVTVKDGLSVVRVEGSLDKPLPGLRLGMEGVAKVEVGRRKLFWIWTHSFIDWLRLSLWAWM